MSFLTERERSLSAAFLHDGYVIAPAEAPAALAAIRSTVVAAAANFLGIASDEHATLLDNIADHLQVDRLNALRLHIIETLRSDPDFRQRYFACARDSLQMLVGNELAMQRSIGLSIQLPDDDSSLLPLHSDAWSEDSPFEVVVWLPLVDCYRTKSMYIAAPAVDRRWRERIAEYTSGGAEAFFRALEPELTWLEVPFGSVLIFTHTLMHGNRVNRESGPRWSLNVRYKGLFTPYSDKQLGDFFEPITVRAATRVGMEYRLPAGFHE